MPVCPNCGKEVGDGVTFCPDCGQRLKTEFTPEERQKYIEELKASIGEGKSAKKTKLTKGKLAGIIVACVIAIIVIIVVATPKCTLSVSVSPSGAGSVSPSGGKYKSGSQVTLTATPSTGYAFDYWDGAATGSLNAVTIVMDSDKAITAHFTEAYTLTVDISPLGAGYVSPSGGQYKPGSSVTLTATPATGYTFDRWSGSASGTSPTIVVTMDSDKAITAHFTKVPEVVYKITGTAESVDVTLSSPTGGTEQYSNVFLPKEYSYSSFSDSFVYISAQNNGSYGTVIVSIYVNGNLFKTSTSSGAYVIATASGLK